MLGQPAWLVTLLFILSACGSAEQGRGSAADLTEKSFIDSVARATNDSVNRSRPGYIVDSILPPAEAMRRFTAPLSSRPTLLANGATSRDALVRKWLKALESNDSITLIRTAINRPEFAYLVYPFSPSATTALYQSPSIVWGQVSSASVQGERRILSKYGGRSLGFLGYQCADAPKKEGENRIWTDCTVRYLRAPGDSADERLFGAIIERQGRFKFFSLANDI